MDRVFSRRRTLLDPVWAPVERGIYHLPALNPAVEMSARQYATCFVIFGLVCTLALYIILRFRRFLPWFFPQYFTTPLTPEPLSEYGDQLLHHQHWQAYAGESTMSYASQMVGLCVQNFLAGAAGLAVGIAFIRGLAREGFETLGNFWVDLTRGLLWILLPARSLGALFLRAQGVPRTSITTPCPCAGRSPSGHSSGAGGRARNHQEPREKRKRLVKVAIKTVGILFRRSSQFLTNPTRRLLQPNGRSHPT